MSGIPQFNFPAFENATRNLRDAGFEVVTPHELDDLLTRAAAWASPDGKPDPAKVNGQTWGDFLARDVKLVADECDAVMLLRGWETSRGARLEAFVALLCGKPLYRYLGYTCYLPIPKNEVAMELVREFVWGTK